MRGGELTPREAEILHQLLLKRGITEYEIAEATPEGQELPGGRYPYEIETVSGYVVTLTHVYLFWLDWLEGGYTLGEHDGSWREVSLDKLGADKDKIMAVQRRLKKP